jgi:hypothetical protein
MVAIGPELAARLDREIERRAMRTPQLATG